MSSINFDCEGVCGGGERYRHIRGMMECGVCEWGCEGVCGEGVDIGTHVV